MSEEQVVKPRRKRGCLTVLLVFIVLLGGGLLLIYFLVPGFFKPYDLGIKATPEAYESAMSKLAITKDSAPKEGTAEDYIYSYGASTAVQTSLSSEEITSFLTINRPEYYAMKDVQVRINEDDTMEASASLDVSYVLEEILDNKYSKEEINQKLPVLGFLPDEVNVYIKADGAIRDNKVADLTIEDVSIMGITIPDSMINTEQANNFIEESLDSYLEKTSEKSGARYDLLQLNNGNLEIQGQLPSSITRTKEE